MNCNSENLHCDFAELLVVKETCAGEKVAVVSDFSLVCRDNYMDIKGLAQSETEKFQYRIIVVNVCDAPGNNAIPHDVVFSNGCDGLPKLGVTGAAGSSAAGPVSFSSSSSSAAAAAGVGMRSGGYVVHVDANMSGRALEQPHMGNAAAAAVAGDNNDAVMISRQSLAAGALLVALVAAAAGVALAPAIRGVFGAPGAAERTPLAGAGNNKPHTVGYGAIPSGGVAGSV